jgi:acylphosphatase
MTAAIKRVHVIVSGQVQGVFFRARCAQRARARGLAGFVRNLSDGRVEAAFEGPEEAVDDLVAWCHEGTDWARVEAVQAADEPVRGEADFKVSR